MSNETNLLSAAKYGDKEAKRKIIDLYSKDIDYIVNQYEPALHEIDDLRQEATLGLLMAMNGYDEHECSFRTYAARCMHNQIRKSYCNQEEFEQLEDFMLVSDDEDAVIEKVDQSKALTLAMKCLTDNERIVLVRSIGHEEDLREIARSIGLSVENVRQLKKRALEKMKERMSVNDS